MFEVATYTSSDVFLVISGYTIQGWNSITITRTAPEFKVIRGIRGKHTRVRNKDSSCTITISLSQVSPTNDVFSDILKKDISEQESSYGNGKLAISLVDKSGSSKFTSSEAFITGFPLSIPFSDNVSDRQWEIFCQKSDWNVGGNASPSNDVVKTILGALGIN